MRAREEREQIAREEEERNRIAREKEEREQRERERIGSRQVTIDLTDARGLTTGFEEGGSRKRKYQEGLAEVEGWGRKKSKKIRANKLGAVFEDQQERQVDLLHRM